MTEIIYSSDAIGSVFRHKQQCQKWDDECSCISSIIKVIHCIRSIHYTKTTVFIVHILSGRYNIVNNERRKLQMKVRLAEERDIPQIHDLLSQVANRYTYGPDLFK